MTAVGLLFELANDDRLTILSRLNHEPLRLSEIARKLSATVQETSRHLERLSEAGLIQRDSSSSYRLTSFGKLILSLMPSFEFLSDEKAFFLSHDLSGLPPAFVERIGELSERHPVDHVDAALAHTEQLIKGAEQYLWLMSDQQVRQSYPHEHSNSTSVRLIFPKSIDTETIQRVRNRMRPNLQIRLADAVKVIAVMNEKTAGIYFQGLDGRIDVSRGFTGESSEFRNWCADLYEFYWAKSQKI